MTEDTTKEPEGREPDAAETADAKTTRLFNEMLVARLFSELVTLVDPSSEQGHLIGTALSLNEGVREQDKMLAKFVDLAKHRPFSSAVHHGVETCLGVIEEVFEGEPTARAIFELFTFLRHNEADDGPWNWRQFILFARAAKGKRTQLANRLLRMAAGAVKAVSPEEAEKLRRTLWTPNYCLFVGTPEDEAKVKGLLHSAADVLAFVVRHPLLQRADLSESLEFNTKLQSEAIKGEPGTSERERKPSGLAASRLG